MNKLLLNIANVITLNLQEIKKIELIGGKMGAVLFYYELYKNTGIKTYSDIADNLLGEVLDNIGKIKNNSIDQGLSGVGWGINYLIRNAFVEVDKDTLTDLEYHIFCSESINFDTGFSTLSSALYLISKPREKDMLDDYNHKISSLLNTCNYYCLSIYDEKKKPLDLINSMLYFLIELKKQNMHTEEVSRLIWRILSYLMSYNIDDDLFGDSAILINLLEQMDDSIPFKKEVLIKMTKVSCGNWNMEAYKKILWQQILFSQKKDELIVHVIPKLLELATNRQQNVIELMVPLGLYLMNAYKSE
ncbi:hypothetical protein [Bacteroides sp.]|uniref:hypothetical protein n=1 Tax=Bacteroides sp. TaxID=29523 RepID=UPI002629E0CC|nr:hypothetical protein [Bacteroides sp.]MDD3038226.1 hypothetical protein [Bacteroides sp.]